MSTAQKIIKYLAIAFACFIIISIVSGIMLGISAFSGFLGLRKASVTLGNLNTITTIENKNFAKLKIDVEYSNLKIVKGEAFKVESNSNDVYCKQNGDTLNIKEDSKWFFNNEASDLIITIPEETSFDEIKIETGAGEVYIEELKCSNLNFEMGAGKVEIQNLFATNKAKIDGGAGKLDILNGEINNLDMDMGVGKCSITAKLTGSNDIDSGVGKLDINLTDEIEGYEIKISKGIGSIKINGKEAREWNILWKWNNIFNNRWWNRKYRYKWKIEHR